MFIIFNFYTSISLLLRYVCHALSIIVFFAVFSVLETNKDLKVAESQLLVGFCNPSPPVTTTPSPRIMEDEENGNIVKQNNKTSNGDSTDDSKMFATQSYPLKRSEAVDTNDCKYFLFI